MNLAVAQGLTTSAQINQIPLYPTALSVMNWIWWVGSVTFGYTIFRTGVYPKVAGLLLALLAPLSYLTGLLDIVTPIFILLTFGVWVWLGWILASKNVAVMETTELQARRRGQPQGGALA
jgi:hypothetical protein